MKTIKYLLLASSTILLSATIFSSASAADLMNKSKVIKAPQTGGICQKPSAAAPASTIAQVAGGDIFGFSSGTDTGAVGDCGIAFESTTRFGKSNGRYESFGLKNQFGFTVADNFSAAVSLFATQHNVKNVTGLSNVSRTMFDGVSGELNYRVLERSKTNPIAVTLSTEPRYSRIDALGGSSVTAYGNEFKLFTDAVLVPEKLFAAVNLNYGVGQSKSALTGSRNVKSSYFNASGALSYQVTDKFFAGVEARYLTSYTGSFLNDKAGYAVFAGPNFLYRISDTMNFNAAWTPQIKGKATGGTGEFDLANFERHQIRAKLTIAF